MPDHYSRSSPHHNYGGAGFFVRESGVRDSAFRDPQFVDRFIGLRTDMALRG